MSIPAGVIAIWRGTIANIPAGWDLCDGNGGRPNLLGKFLRSVPAATDPGGGGGSDTHTHVESGTGGSHNHGGTSGAGGSHSHTSPTETGSHSYSVHGSIDVDIPGSLGGAGNNRTAGNHNHSWGSGSDNHTHTINTLGSHDHTLQNADTRPAYYQVAFIYSDGSPVTFAEGIITLWSDILGNIPAGWALDATLVAKFLRGVPAATDPGGTGGADSHTHTQDADGAHTHTLASSSWSHTHTSNSGGSHNHGNATYNPATANSGRTTSEGSHTHGSGSGGSSHSHSAASAGSHSHTVNNSDGRPPYYELAPIDADVGGANLKVGLICIWTGTIANIPADWELCDGNGGRPNLLTKFIRGVATAGTNPGGTSGDLTHTHTVQDAGNHTHTDSSAGSHRHTGSSATWSHWHGAKESDTAGKVILARSYYGPSHSHGYLSYETHNDHSISYFSHSDHTYGTGSSLPVYYEVAFIYCTSVMLAGGMGAKPPIMELLLAGVID